jgi:hypothetical protein
MVVHNFALTILILNLFKYMCPRAPFFLADSTVHTLEPKR